MPTRGGVVLLEAYDVEWQPSGFGLHIRLEANHQSLLASEAHDVRGAKNPLSPNVSCVSCAARSASV